MMIPAVRFFFFFGIDPPEIVLFLSLNPFPPVAKALSNFTVANKIP